MDGLQAAITKSLAAIGFRRRGRTFNRRTEEGLVQVIGFQMGAFDPPGTVPIPGLRENLYGRFTVNLGVHVPEVAKYHGAPPRSAFIQDHDCCLRARLGELGPERQDLWWPLTGEAGIEEEILRRLDRDALPWIGRFATRDLILREMAGVHRGDYATVPRIVSALILLERGDREGARALLIEQAEEVGTTPHAAYVRSLAERLGLESLT